MFTLRVILRALNADKWLNVIDLNRQANLYIGSHNFALNGVSQEAHVFYDIDEVRDLIADIGRSLNRVGPAGEKYDESMEWHQGITKVIRHHLRDPNERWAFSFEICEVRLEGMGKVAVNLRSDIL